MVVRAAAPGSVTTVFVPSTDDAGSLGVSFATEDGVTVALTPADRTHIVLDGEPTDFAPVEGVLSDLGLSARVEITSEIPVGRGFGASGAATLATALAANERFDLGEPRDGLVQAAHRAEMAAGTGQGDVFVQDVGGLVWNTGAGMGRRERSDPVTYATFEGISTAEVLGDQAALERITSAGRDALESFDPAMAWADWLDISWEFAAGTGLVTDPVVETVEAVHEAGGAATMAMVGETVIASGESSVLPAETAITSTGATVLGA